jgi:hypothetical protein
MEVIGHQTISHYRRADIRSLEDFGCLINVKKIPAHSTKEKEVILAPQEDNLAIVATIVHVIVLVGDQGNSALRHRLIPTSVKVLV